MGGNWKLTHSSVYVSCPCQPDMQGLYAHNVSPEEPSGSTIFYKEYSSLAQQ